MPGSTRSTRQKLVASKPAPTSTTSANATSAITNVITVIVGTGPGSVVVPDCSGQSVETCQQILEASGFPNAVPVEVDDTAPSGQVVGLSPTPGQPAPKPETLAAGTVVVEGPPAPPAGASKEETDKYAKDVADVRRSAQAKPLEHRLYYADYRDAGNGVMLPFRLRRAIGPDTVEETNFDAFRFNQKIDPRKFEPVK